MRGNSETITGLSSELDGQASRIRDLENSQTMKSLLAKQQLKINDLEAKLKYDSSE